MLGQLALSVELAGYIFPFLVVDEGIHHDVGALLVVVQTLVVVQLFVGDDRWQQVVVELATAQLRHLVQEQGTSLFQLLLLVRSTGYDEG